MSYSTAADVQVAAGGERSLRELSDVDGDNAVNGAAIESAIVEADALINSYVHKRYGVDLPAPAPPTIRTMSAAMAVYIMKSRRRNMLTEIDLEMQKQRVEQLEKFAKGETSLGVSPVPGKSEYVSDAASDRPSDKDVSREKLRGFW